MRSLRRSTYELNDRRIQLLRAIVEEYVRTAEPVGSKNLVRRYRLKVSPATVRNEMAVLVDAGFLMQPHTSAGRIPAPMGLRYYIYQLMSEDRLPVLEEVAVKQKLTEVHRSLMNLMYRAVALLTEKTKETAFLVTEDDAVVSSGIVHLLDNPEFYDIEVARAVLSFLENPEMMRETFSLSHADSDVQVLIGDEIEIANFETVGIAFTEVNINGTEGYLGLIGPYRMNYPSVIPTLRYMAGCLNSL